MEVVGDEDADEYFTGEKQITVVGLIKAGWKTSEVTKSGVRGAPTYATADKGHKLFDYALNKLLDIMHEYAEVNY